jgi:hypothetical protein
VRFDQIHQHMARVQVSGIGVWHHLIAMCYTGCITGRGVGHPLWAPWGSPSLTSRDSSEWPSHGNRSRLGYPDLHSAVVDAGKRGWLPSYSGRSPSSHPIGFCHMGCFMGVLAKYSLCSQTCLPSYVQPLGVPPRHDTPPPVCRVLEFVKLNIIIRWMSVKGASNKDYVSDSPNPLGDPSSTLRPQNLIFTSGLKKVYTPDPKPETVNIWVRTPVLSHDVGGSLHHR